MTEATIAGTAPIYVELEKEKSYYWCSWGLSAKQPFCDGSHKGTDFKPLEFTANETKSAALCACKQTENGPFCDGKHKQL
jgi:CDGSH-type Zn-finger protein